MSRHRWRGIPQGTVAVLLAAVLLSGCANLGYYGHLWQGQRQVLKAREPIAEIVADEARDPRLRRRLSAVAEARRFAVEQLALPDSDSYRSYVALDRPHVLWNVFAAPEFSLQAHQWCYPFYGCFSYRGYYDEEKAQAEAQRLAARGLDVHVGGVSAYSTLGAFADPVLSSMMHWDEATLIGTVFHELAHERFHLRDDTAFNESFATFVEQEGLRQWYDARGEAVPEATQRLRRRQRDFLALLMQTRQRLQALYAEPPPEVEALRARKAGLLAQLEADYRALRDTEWGGWSGYDGWFEQPVNNARLVSVGLYQQWVPAFAQLFARCGGDWAAFFAAVEALGERPPQARQRRLEALQAESRAA